MKKWWWIIPVSLVVSIAFPFLVNLGVTFLPIHLSGNSGVWISFWGSYLGGIFTLVAVVISILAQHDLAKKEVINRLIEKDLEVFNKNLIHFRETRDSALPWSNYYFAPFQWNDSPGGPMVARFGYRDRVYGLRNLFFSKKIRSLFDDYANEIVRVNNILNELESDHGTTSFSQGCNIWAGLSNKFDDIANSILAIGNELQE
jgi:hypothetical protein